MPQNANAVYPAVNNGVSKPLKVDSNGALIVADNVGSESVTLNVAATTVILNGPGYVGKVSVTVAGALGNLYDNNQTGSGNTAANLICAVPATVGVITLDWPVTVGITYVPGAAQVASISYRPA